MADTPGESFASWLRTQWARADTALARERRDFWLNYSFVEGEQWVWWNTSSREVAEFPRPSGDRVRLTDNRMQPNLVTLLAKHTQRALTFEVPPSDTDDASLLGAKLGQHLLESHAIEQGWERLRLDEVLSSYLGGTSAVLVEWDKDAGQTLTTGADGKEVREGNVQLTALSIAEFTVEPGSRSWRDARWFITATAMPPEQAMEHYGLTLEPKADAQAASGPLLRRLWSERGFPTNISLTTVFTYYERPNKKLPKGRHAVVIGDDTVLDEPWPFPWKDHLNLRPFRQQQRPNRWQGGTCLNDVRPLQVAYNHGRSTIAEHMKLAGNARLAIPDNSGVEVEDLNDEAGQPFFYDGMSSKPPGYVDPPNLPRWMLDEIQQCKESIDDLMYVHDISRGEAPGDRNSGLALSVLGEKDETPLGLMAREQAEGWGEIGSMCLQLWADKVPEWRSATVQNNGLPLSRQWTGRELRGQTQVKVPLDATLPQSKAATQAWIIQFAQAFPNMVPQNPAQLARLLDLPNAAMFTDMLDADVAQAEHENLEMSVGKTPALGDQPYPMQWDAHDVHIAEHNRFRKGQSYISAPADIRRLVDLHIAAHEKMAVDEAIHQRQLNQIVPDAGGVPQGHEPPGSAVPPDYIERRQAGAPALPGAAPTAA